MGQERLTELLRNFFVEGRTRAGLSQSDVAARSDVFGLGPVLDQRAVSRLEQQPLNVDAIKVAGYLSAIGVPLERYYGFLEKVSQPNGGNMLAIGNSDSIRAHISEALDKVSVAETSLRNCGCPYLNGLDLFERLDGAKAALRNLNRKPIIGFFGHFDAGKSTIINTVLGQNILTTQYAPATCIVNLVMHRDDRPKTLQGQVSLFRRGFSPHMINDEALVSDYLIEDGDFNILERLGVHNYDESIPNDAYIAIVFAESEILRHIWLLDTPGDLNNSDEGNNDSQKALGGAELADGIVFVSGHTGFFKGDDLGFAADILRNHPPLSPNAPTTHLLFIQSHCHSAVNPDDVERVRHITFKRIKRQVEELIFKHWKADGALQDSPTPEQMADRIQPFWRENDLYRIKTLERIQELALFLTKNQNERTLQNISIVLAKTKEKFHEAMVRLEGRKQDSIHRLQEVQQQDARFRKEAEQLISEFSRLIDKCEQYRQDDKDTMKNYYDAKTSVEALVDIIDDVYDDKKEAQAGVGNYIGQLFSAKLESTLKCSGNSISDKVDNLLVRWQQAIPSALIGKSNINGSCINPGEFNGFDSRAAFVSGLAGLGSLGAMALYVSTIASNLGAYILVAKVAGILVSLGLVGSVTTVTSFVAAIGGPITIGIALAALIGLAVYSLFGGSWQKVLAKKVSTAIRKSNAWEDMESSVNKFWDSTKVAIAAGVKELRTQTEVHINELMDDAKTEYNVESLDSCIEFLHTIGSSLAKDCSSKTVG